jgi:hypothetical protein
MATAMGDHGLKPVGDFDLTGSGLFDANVGVTVSNAAGSDDESVADVSITGGAVTVIPMVAGAARITVTATVAAPAGVEDLFSAVEGGTAEEGEVLTLVAVVRRPTSP